MEHVLKVLPGFLVFIALVLIFIASQIFWMRQISRLGREFITSRRLRRWLGWAGVALFFVLFGCVFLVPGGGEGRGATHLTVTAALLVAPFRWWFVGSNLGFLILVCLGIIDRIVRALAWLIRASLGLLRRFGVGMLRPAQAAGTLKAAPVLPASLARRRFLEQTALAVGAMPFGISAWGLAYGRTDLEITHQRIKLPRLPKAFHGFRIAQLSDIHIGPFMSAEEIRKFATLANQLRPDLILLTGDFVTWDPSTQGAVVQALSGLRAPFGVFGCLGNHELWTGTQDSITRFFAETGVSILRGQRVPIKTQSELLNLIGVDFQTRAGMGKHLEGYVHKYLEGIEPLIFPDSINILMSHNPNTFDRAAELGIDLNLAGHTHGGQLALEFVSPEISPSRLITPYVAGWFEKRGAQLYVNRGIGTIGVPIRVGAPPEITIFELVRPV